MKPSDRGAHWKSWAWSSEAFAAYGDDHFVAGNSPAHRPPRITRGFCPRLRAPRASSSKTQTGRVVTIGDITGEMLVGPRRSTTKFFEASPAKHAEANVHSVFVPSRVVDVARGLEDAVEDAASDCTLGTQPRCFRAHSPHHPVAPLSAQLCIGADEHAPRLASIERGMPPRHPTRWVACNRSSGQIDDGMPECENGRVMSA